MNPEESQIQPAKRWNSLWLLLVVFTGFLIFGFSENSKGPALPRMQADFSLSEWQIGLLLSLNSLGYLLACSFTIVLTNKLGLRFTMLMAFGSMAISGLFMYLSYNYAALSASYFLMYVGNGILEIGLALLTARIFVKNTGMMMNLSHFFYGLSSIVAPLFASMLMGLHLFDMTLSWGGMYLVMLSLAIIPMIPALFASFPKDTVPVEERVSYVSYMKDPAAWLIVGILSFGVVSELAVGGWLVNFLEKAYEWTPTAAAGMLSAFFVCFTAARLILGPVTDRIGFIKSLIIFSGSSGLFTVAAIVTGEPGAFLFALAGIGIAPIYPTVMAYLARYYSRNSDTAITFTVTMMGIACIIGNLLIGGITEWTKDLFSNETGSELGLLRGLQAGYLFIALCALLCMVLSVILYRFLNKRGGAL
ncbi:MFS transporter [Paenibacillus nasutitermitis]|uniref:MFS transporter n=1 Tax=Paenibacillus nasutitermitis TaxID=1652958 RepID=A0A916ZFM7_9BACL|nr:MFS transporter [Paenibacillus nasutitermitis]